MRKLIIAIILIATMTSVLILINNNKNNKNEEPSNEENTIDNIINEPENENKEIVEEAKTPVEIHGKLNVDGIKIVDKNGDTMQLRGISTHGLQWYPQYVTKDTFKYIRDEWGINVVRLAMYTDPNVGYKKELHDTVKNGIDYATELGLYVIVDWHILSDGNPNTYKTQAIEFFKEIASKYKDNENIIYEICNEPNGNVTWEKDVKPYAEEVIKEIRKIDSDAIIICGTPTWCQDVDRVAKNPIQGYDNIMYALHFYAATHTDWLRNRTKEALDAGLPIFVSEFGICDASGNGSIDYTQADKWIEFLDENNISWLMWSLSNKAESASAISSSCNKTTGWTEEELAESGLWLVNTLKKYKEN